VLRIRPFRRLWMVLGVASFGDWLGLLATAIFASSQVSGSVAQGAAFSGTIAVRLLPAMLLGPLAGVMADRFDRRYTMIICDLVRFLVYGSIPLVALLGLPGGVVVAWATIATFIGEAFTLIWIPAKEAAVPNLIPRGRLEVSNQLTLITTYGITPVLAALLLSAVTAVVQQEHLPVPAWAAPTELALWFNAFSRLATALVVFLGIREIGGRSVQRVHAAQQTMLRQLVDGWKYVGQTPLVRGLVLGILGAFAGGGIVVGTAKFFATSLGAGEAAFYLLFATMFIGLGAGIGLGPFVVRGLSRRRWFGMSIVLASASVIFLAFSFHLTMALIGAFLVGAGAGMAFLAGTTLLGGEVGDEVRGRVFAVVQIGTRVVLLLAIALSGVLVGLGSSRHVQVGKAGLDISSTRVLLFVAGVLGVAAGVSAFRQMDDKRGVPVLADLWGSLRGRPLVPSERFARHGVFVVFEGGEGAGKSTQADRLAAALRELGHDAVLTREPGATGIGARIRGLVLDPVAPDEPSPRAEALLYAADRAHHVATVIRPALARGAVVVSDRYVDSSVAYQGAGRSLPLDEVSWLSSWATGGLKPDLVVVLDLDPAVGLARAGASRADADRLEAEPLDFHERVRHAFLDLAADDPTRYVVLDATRPPEELTQLVLARLAPLLPGPAQPPGRHADPRSDWESEDTQVIPIAVAPLPGRHAQPDATLPEASLPEASLPEASPPHAARPDTAAAPNGAEPDAAQPAAAQPHAAPPRTGSDETQPITRLPVDDSDVTQVIPSIDTTKTITAARPEAPPADVISEVAEVAEPAEVISDVADGGPRADVISEVADVDEPAEMISEVAQGGPPTWPPPNADAGGTATRVNGKAGGPVEPAAGNGADGGHARDAVDDGDDDDVGESAEAPRR
jgi:dTMP kinase